MHIVQVVLFFITDFQDKEYSLARPRRMSELNVANKVVPIPPGSSFFIMSQTNRLKQANSIYNSVYRLTIF